MAGFVAGDNPKEEPPSLFCNAKLKPYRNYDLDGIPPLEHARAVA
jgi:hypothetical protein